MMKSYKLVNSKEIGHKLERLGINTYNYSSSHPFVFIDGKECSSFFMIGTYASLSKEEITQKDFLALPEPLKVGDWLMWVYKSEALVFRASEVNEDFVYSDSVCESTEGYCIENCFKLTPEQIEVLGL